MSFKAPSWEKLDKLVVRTDLYDTDVLDNYLTSVPKKYRKAVALALSVVKWSPDRDDWRGRGDCGCCAFAHMMKNLDPNANMSECAGYCPLGKKQKISCLYSRSLYYSASNTNNSLARRKKAADKLYNILVELYTDEYNSL